MNKQERIEKMKRQRLDYVCLKRKLKEKDSPSTAIIISSGMQIEVPKKVVIKVLNNSINSMDGRIRLEETNPSD